MTLNGKALLAAAALLCLGLPLHIAASVARGEDSAENRGGVLFYAGFDASVDADYAVGNPKIQAPEAPTAAASVGVTRPL